LPVPLLLFVEGEHDAIFFRSCLRSSASLGIKTVKTLAAEHQVREMFLGILIVESGGIPRIYKVISRLMRQIIVNLSLPFLKLVAVADSDRFSVEALCNDVSIYLRTPCKSHRLEFGVNFVNSSVTLEESTKERTLEILCHVVPENLEEQLLRKVPVSIKRQIPSEGTIDSKLKRAAVLMDFQNVDSFVEASADWFASEPWMQNIKRDLQVCQ